MKLAFFASLIFIFASSVFADDVVTVSGRLLDPSSNPVVGNSVHFKIEVLDPGVSACPLRAEDLGTLDMTNSSGLFELKLGTGVSSSVYTLREAFSNAKTFTGLSGCAVGTTYTPSSSDGRKLRITFNDGSGNHILGLIDIDSVPFSLSAQAVGGFDANALLRVSDSGTPGNVTPLTTANFNELSSLIAGTSAQYTKSGQLNGVAVPAMTSGQVLGWSGSTWNAVTPLTAETDPSVQGFAKSVLPSCAVGEVLKASSNNFVCVSSGGLTTIGTAGDYTKVTTDAYGRVISGAVLSEVDVPNLNSAGKVAGNAITSGTIGGSASMVSTGAVSVSTVAAPLHKVYNSTSSNYVGLTSPAALSSNYTLNLPSNPPNTGQALTSDGAGNLSWSTPAAPFWMPATGGISYTGGSVGIGTNIPMQALDVTGSANISGKYYIQNVQALANTGSNILVGQTNALSSGTGSNNTVTGNMAGNSLTNGSHNTLFGYRAGGSLSDGSANVLIGRDAGSNAISANNNIVIGTTSYPSLSSGTNNVVIGHNIDLSDGSGNLRLGNWISGDNAGKVGIGTTTPSSRLTVNGTIESTAGGVKFPDGTIQLSAPLLTGNIMPYITSSVFVVPNGVTRLKITAIGGGGGGAGSSLSAPGSGGGGGGVTVAFVNVTPGATYTVTVGIGGNKGVSGTAGAMGTASSFDTLVTANGGTGGTVGGAGGAGATGGSTTGTILHIVAGQTGSVGVSSYSGFAGGNGGSTFAGWGLGGTSGANAAGTNGVGYGGGGGGAGLLSSSFYAGGNGAGGAVFVEW